MVVDLVVLSVEVDVNGSGVEGVCVCVCGCVGGVFVAKLAGHTYRYSYMLEAHREDVPNEPTWFTAYAAANTSAGWGWGEREPRSVILAHAKKKDEQG